MRHEDESGGLMRGRDVVWFDAIGLPDNVRVGARMQIGICGQGPSNYPDVAEVLVGQGIDLISLDPDTLLRTVHRIKEAEVATIGDWPTLGRVVT